MNIPINEDFEKDYKIEVWKGFDLKELISLVIGVALGGGLGCVLYFVFRLDMMISFYVGIIPALPFIFISFWKSPLGLSLPAHLETKHYQRMTRRLVVKTEEYESAKQEYLKTMAYIEDMEQKIARRKQDADTITGGMKRAYHKDLRRRNRIKRKTLQEAERVQLNVKPEKISEELKQTDSTDAVRKGV